MLGEVETGGMSARSLEKKLHNMFAVQRPSRPTSNDAREPCAFLFYISTNARFISSDEFRENHINDTCSLINCFCSTRLSALSILWIHLRGCKLAKMWNPCLYNALY